MIDASDGLPAHIAVLLNEKFDFSDSRAAMRKLKGMTRELKDQSTSTPVASKVSTSDGFKAVLSGGLDLFGGMGACQAPPCRIGYASQIARSIALMADEVIVGDSFFDEINSLKSRPTNNDIFPLLVDVMVLKKIQPLIEAGILKFSTPLHQFCLSCAKPFEERIDILTDQVLREIYSSLKIDRSGETATLDFTQVYSPGVLIHLDAHRINGVPDEQIIRESLKDCIRTTFFDAQSASSIGGSVFSNSPAGISALISDDRRSEESWNLQAFSAERAANLPWVSGLSIKQTLELRSAASAALPSLREFLARRLTSTPSSLNPLAWVDTVAELREQAATARAELEIATSRSASLKRSATGILGLCVSAVCLATEGPTTALGGLLGTLGLIHSMPAPDSNHSKEIKTRPGYVLVAAEEILKHAI
ncbi:hypothetical protein [Stenotrophomonas sp. ASS1]|uniref:hypothetical protein n=1 Tax=Stenotrophomonas sp. ASS1 TaxID=2282124 RepID=UPI001053D4B6|nr:hypothetical protein [Stenotrophomonas sp. ASS1]